MAILKYYWDWIWSATKGAWGKFAVAMGIFTLFTRYIEDKFPEQRPSMNTPLWEYPLWVFVVTGLIGFL